MDKESREIFDTWRRDAGEVIVCAFYILRDEMLGELTRIASEQINGNADWQDLEATLHCISFSSEAVPLGEEVYLPVIFGQLLQQLAQRDQGEARLRRTVVGLIAAYEEWFKFHPDHLLPCLNYLVTSLSSPNTAPTAANTLKSLCDMCRKKLVEHIGAFADLHGKIGSLGVSAQLRRRLTDKAEEQVKVVQAITSVIQALSPDSAIPPVEVSITSHSAKIRESLDPFWISWTIPFLQSGPILLLYPNWYRVSTLWRRVSKVSPRQKTISSM